MLTVLTVAAIPSKLGQAGLTRAAPENFPRVSDHPFSEASSEVAQMPVVSTPGGG